MLHRVRLGGLPNQGTGNGILKIFISLLSVFHEVVRALMLLLATNPHSRGALYEVHGNGRMRGGVCLIEADEDVHRKV